MRSALILLLLTVSAAWAQPTGTINARRIWGRNICSNAPTDTQVLAWNAASNCWKAAAAGGAPSGAAGGDLSGTFPNPTVAKINGATVGTATPTAANLLIASGTAWVTNALSGDATLGSTGILTLANSGVSASTYTKLTVDAKGRATVGDTATLASADFANQGTTTTVLHGNAAGNPSFAQVSLVTTVTGALQAANFGALTGDVTSAGATYATTLAAKHRTRQAIFVLGADNGAVLADTDDQASIYVNRLGSGVTITEVWCESDAGTPSINLQRDDGTPADVLSANLTCTTSGATGTINLAEDNVADTERIDLLTITAGGTAKRVTVAIKFTID